MVLAIFLPLAFSVLSQAASESAPSISDTLHGFSEKTAHARAALSDSLAEGCLIDEEDKAVVRQADELVKTVGAFVPATMSALEFALAKPIEAEAGAACRGSFSAIQVEGNAKLDELAIAKEKLKKASGLQAAAVTILLSSESFSIRHSSCGRKLFRDLKGAIESGADGWLAIGRLQSDLSLREQALHAWMQQNGERRAACGSEEGLTAVNGGTAGLGAGVSPAGDNAHGSSTNSASSITGVEEDRSKRQK